MSDGILSQEEIDALLAGNANDGIADINEDNTNITDQQKDTLGEIGNISMGTAATTLSLLLKRKVSITTPDVSITTREKIQDEYPLPYLIVEVQYAQGLSGSNLLSVKTEDACIIADLMMGREIGEKRGQLDEMELSAVGEAMNQMMGSATTSLSSMFNQRIDIASPVLSIIDFGKEKLDFHSDCSQLVQIKFKMEIEDAVKSEIMQIIPMEAVARIIDALEKNVEEITTHNVKVEPELSGAGSNIFEKPEESNNLDSTHGSPRAAAALSWGEEKSENVNSTVVGVGESYTVQPVQFSVLQKSKTGEFPQNIGLIMDVPLDISVELGKTRKTIKEILELQQGSIIQLDKMAGEPVDLLVNGKLIARGEVVVIDENYGIRISNIISQMDRVTKLQ